MPSSPVICFNSLSKGNCLNEKGDLERAKELYLEAIGVEADCVEAIYNLGLVNKDLNLLAESLQAFEKLHTIIPSSPEVLYHIGNLHDMLGHQRAAEKYFKYLISKVPSDPTALSRLGQIFSKDEDELQAYHYHHEVWKTARPTAHAHLNWHLRRATDTIQ